jgi:hypothetical protein
VDTTVTPHVQPLAQYIEPEKLLPLGMPKRTLAQKTGSRIKNTMHAITFRFGHTVCAVLLAGQATS